mmetsp:Transcript_1099/g.1198  ORF Transcript_1099/g.1198 Transcript_1099/m.1198 type:complete len:350 (-) Transcript_1099:13-1062(-)
MTEQTEQKDQGSLLDIPKSIIGKKTDKGEATLLKKIDVYMSNRILNSYANVVEDSFEAENVTLYVWDKPFVKYSFELEAVKMAFGLLGVKYHLISSPYKHIYLGELPILQIDDLFLQNKDFIDALFKIVFDEGNIAEYIANKRIFTLCQNELKKITEYFMWVEPSTVYLSYRDPYWLLASPIMKYEQNIWLQTKKVALANSGLTSMEEALEKAASLLSELNHIFEAHNSFYIGQKEDDPRGYINNIIVYCALTNILENQPFSPLCKLLIEQFPKLFQFASEFKGNYEGLQNRFAAATLKIKLRTKNYNHGYKARKTEEGPKKLLNRKNVITTVAIAAIFGAYYYYRDKY